MWRTGRGDCCRSQRCGRAHLLQPRGLHVHLVLHRRAGYKLGFRRKIRYGGLRQFFPVYARQWSLPSSISVRGSLFERGAYCRGRSADDRGGETGVCDQCSASFEITQQFDRSAVIGWLRSGLLPHHSGRQDAGAMIAVHYLIRQPVNAASNTALPVAAHTCAFQCIFKSFTWGTGVFAGARLAATDGAAGCGMSDAKLVTVIKIKFTAAVTLANNVGLVI